MAGKRLIIPRSRSIFQKSRSLRGSNNVPLIFGIRIVFAIVKCRRSSGEIAWIRSSSLLSGLAFPGMSRAVHPLRDLGTSSRPSSRLSRSAHSWLHALERRVSSELAGGLRLVLDADELSEMRCGMDRCSGWPKSKCLLSAIIRRRHQKIRAPKVCIVDNDHQPAKKMR